VPNLRYIRKLGEGGFGEVWLAEDLGVGAQRAVKFVPPSAIPDLSTHNAEARVLNELQHANVIKVYGTEIIPEDDTGPGAGMYAIIMEYMGGGSLGDVLDRGESVPLRGAVKYISDACRGAERAHASGYVHRDIKPANILLSLAGQTKLSDFGLCVATAEGLASGAGTLHYIAPEVFETGVTSVQSDIYSLGVTIYELLNGSKFLRWNGTEEELVDAVALGRFPDRAAYQPFVPEAIRRVIRKALNVAPDKRYKSVEEFRHALQRVPINCNWQLRRSGDPEVWLGTGENGLFRVTISVSRGTFELSRCKVVPGRLRRVTVDCLETADAQKLLGRQRAVMQRITTLGR